MKPTSNPFKSLINRIACCGLLAPTLTVAATWNGSGGDANWSTAGNWDVVPVAGDPLIFGGSLQTSNNNDFDALTSFGSISFATGASAFTLGGNSITLAGNITNSSTSTQTINTAIETAAVRTVTMTAGGGNVTIGSVVSGAAGGLATAGSGTLSLNDANTYAGATTVGAGTTLKVGNTSALGATTGALTVASGGTLDLNGNSVTKGNFTANSATATVTSATAATLTINHQNTGNLYSGLSLTGAASLIINGGSGTNQTLGTGATVAGTGSLGFQNQTNVVRVNGLATNLGANGTLRLLGSGMIQNSSTVTLGANNPIVISGTGNKWDYQQNGTNGLVINGTFSGSGTINSSQGFNANLVMAGDMTGFSGVWNFQNSGTSSNNSSQLRFTNTTASVAGSANASFTQSALVTGNTGTNAIAWAGTGNRTIALGNLTTTVPGGFTAGGGIFLQNNTASTTATFEVGALNLSSTYSGVIRNNSGTTALTKVGTGTWTLTGASTYTGATSVTGGTLAVTGSLGATACSAAAGTTLVVGSGTLDSLAISGGATFSMENGSIGSLSIGGTNGVTLGGPMVGGKSFLKLEAGGAFCDSMAITNSLTIDAGGVDLTVAGLGIESNTDYVLATFSAGTGAGFATGTGTTVGGLTLTNPSLAFGVTGTLVVDSTSVILRTSGAAAPSVAYWSGAKGVNWTDNSSGQGNFTTTAAGGTFVAANPGALTDIFFTNNSATNLSNTLGGNFTVNGITYRGTSGAVSTGGTHQIQIGAGGITVESGNGGAVLAMSNLVLGDWQTWTNNSSNPLVVSATVNSPSQALTVTGSGSLKLGGPGFTVGTLTLDADLDLAGTPLTAEFQDSTGDVTNSGASSATLNVSASNPVILSGVISDGTSAVAVNKTGAATLTLSGVNSYSGITSINGGTVILGNASALGSNAGGTTMATGSVLDLNGQTIAENLSAINGAFITNTSGTGAAITGEIGNTGAFTVNGTGDITIGHVFNTAAFNVTKSGTNTLTLANPVDNGFASFILNEGTLVLACQTTGNKATDNLTINAGLVRLDTIGGALGNISDTRPVTINGGSLDLNGFNEAVGNLSAVSVGGLIVNNAVGTSVLTVGGTASSGNYAGSISDGGAGKLIALTKIGTGTQTLTGTLSYTGSTTVNNGTLSIASSTLSDTATVAISATGILDLTHADTDVVGSLVIDDVPLGDGIYDASNTGGRITGTGKLQVGTGVSGYSAWAASNAGGQTPELDFDGDGVENGVEYFMNSAAGFTANPAVVGGTVTWPNGGNIPSSAYGTQFKVQTSSNLGTWTDVLVTDPNLANTSGSVSYTLPTGAGKLFVRLVVSPN